MIRGSVGCLGGRLVGAVLIVVCRVLNPRRARLLGARERTLMEAVIPDVDLDRVAIVECALLPISSGMRAMTLGHTIYVRGSRLDDRSSHDMSLLLHELVHVRQVIRAGSVWWFLCAYGREWIAHLSYAANALEIEARDVERARAGELATALAELG